MKQKQHIIFLFIFLFPLSLWAQISVPGVPLSFSSNLKKSVEIPTTQLLALDIDNLLAEDSANGITNRFAVSQFVSINIKKVGISTIANNGQYWQYRFLASNSYSLGIHFSSYKIPKGANVFIYNGSHTKLLGAFTNINNRLDRMLAIAQLDDKEAIIEYFEPDSAEFEGDVVIGFVSQSYKNISSVLSYNDIVCSKWSDWSDVKHSVCLMTFMDGGDEYLCTGSLLNNTRNDATPYFLTANHCISTQESASTLVTYFNYENNSCNGVVVNKYQTLSGSTLCEHSSNTDFTLLRLDELPPDEYKPYYAGWDVSNSNPGTTTCIHHPKGYHKSIAQSTKKARIYPYYIPWTDGTQTPPRTHWEITFTDGTTDEGSSGSPIFDQNKRVFGQLHGGDNTTNYYGILSLSWNSIKKWLDPDNSGVENIDGLYGKIIPVANFSFSNDYACINSGVDLYDSSLFGPTTWHWNITPSDYKLLNSTTTGSESPVISFLRDTMYTIELTVSNKNGSNTISKQIQIGEIDFSIIDYPQGKEICGYALNNTAIKVSGKYNYSFFVDKTSLIDTATSGNTIALSLKEKAFNGSTFTTQIIAKANQGVCVAYDTLDLKVIVVGNDMARNAKMLKLGESGPFNNGCASVEVNEPHPLSVGCLVKDSWCIDSNNPDTVINNTLWFQFYGPSNGLINIEARGFDTRIAVYKADNYYELFSSNSKLVSLVAANDNKEVNNTSSQLKNVNVVFGEKYWLQVDGFKHEEGDAYIKLYSNALEVYPNPTNGKFTLVVALAETAEGNIKIVSSTGKTIYSVNTAINVANNAINVDLSSYSPGLYMIYCTIGGQSYTSKVMVIR